MKNNVAAVVTGIFAFGSLSEGQTGPASARTESRWDFNRSNSMAQGGPRQLWKINVSIGHYCTATPAPVKAVEKVWVAVTRLSVAL